MEQSSTSNIKAKLFPKQREFFKLVLSRAYDFILYGGSVRGGKTYSLLLLFLMLSKAFPRSRWVIVRKDTERIKTTVLPTFNRLYPVDQTVKYPSIGNGWEWHHVNGSVIKFFGENKDKDPELLRFRGLECDGIGFDELDVSEATFYKAFERVGTWMMDKRQESKLNGENIPPQLVIATSNPQDGWVKEKIYNPHRSGTLKYKWKYLESRVYDNPYVEPEYIQRQRDNLLPEDFEKFINGDWDTAKNKNPFFRYYNDNVHYSEDHYPFFEGVHLWLSFDFNINPCTVTVHQFVEGSGMYTMREMSSDMGTLALCQEIDKTDIMDVPIWLWKVTGDSSGMNRSATSGNVNNYDIIQDYFKLDWGQIINVSERNKSHEYSRTLCDQFLYRCPYVIDNSCKELRKDLKKAKPSKSGKLFKNDGDFGMHFVDGFRYVIDAKFYHGLQDIKAFAALCE